SRPGRLARVLPVLRRMRHGRGFHRQRRSPRQPFSRSRHRPLPRRRGRRTRRHSPAVRPLTSPSVPTSQAHLAAQLRALGSAPPPSVAIGFDGFVDEMIRVVGERQSPDRYTAVPTIADFGELIGRAAGHSSLREIVVTAVHAGGCAVNMGDGLAALGIPVDAFATLGEPAHPAFEPITRRFRSVHSWGREPGRTLAYEFADGKLMFSSVAQLAELTAEHAKTLLADGAYAAACREARLIALTDWALYPHMTAVWQLLQREVYARLTHRPRFFIDLVDPSGRGEAEDRKSGV